MFESKSDRTVNITLGICGIVIGLIGFWFLAQIDWRLATGIFFIIWGRNLAKRLGA